MHAIRRRKKRTNYGVRSVELVRGKNGFGFTISGQQPCILSCIVSGSPAEKAGLRPGDYLVAVNSQSVSKIPHDDVVRLIGSCFGLLKLQIAENYYSDSSDEEVFAPARVKPKHVVKPRQANRPVSAPTTQQNRAAKVVRDLRTGAMFVEQDSEDAADIPAVRTLPPPPPRQQAKPEYRAVVGYLGTIEMPSALQVGCRLQVVRGCIRRLRGEKRVPTLVLMSLHSGALVLTDARRQLLAEYPAERVMFVGAGADDSFGLVTSAEEPRSSCHVFAVARRLLDHAGHATTAASFGLLCSGDPAGCLEFPGTSEPVVTAIRSAYERNQLVSPQPSDSATVSSNSDSGIGFRDESRLTVRASSSSEDLSVRREEDMSCGSDAARSVEEHKLGMARSVEDVTASVGLAQHWGSLQELRSFVANCFHAAPAADHHTTQAKFHKWHSSGVGKTFIRGNLLSRSLPHRHPQDDEGKKRPDRPVSEEAEERSGGVASWADSFEKLIEDPAGLHTFAEFLKKEFSHENIYFWVACEKYRQLGSATERQPSARQIFAQHLCLGAVEPVNVDSHARQVTQDSLDAASEELFAPAQKQIFNLMKFDSYPRFIKSDLYKECLLRHMAGQQLPYPGGEGVEPGLQLRANHSPDKSKLVKSVSDAEDRRKSLLPWHRKNRSKSRDAIDPDSTDVTSSRSSLTSWDSLSRDRALCRVSLPDGATTVVQTSRSEAVRDMVLRLLDKRGVSYSSFQVFTQDSIKPVSLDAESCLLSNKEVRVEQRVVFRLDLPNRKTVGVKAKPCKTLAEVLRPILNKYNYRLEQVTVCLMSANSVVEISSPVLSVDNQRLQVLTRSTDSVGKCDKQAPGVPTLDEITNRVFEELLQGKSDDRPSAADQNSVKSEDWGSEHSSGIFGRFLRRDSSALSKTRESRGKSKKVAEMEASQKLTLNTKLKPGVMMHAKPELLSPELFEGLKRAQRSRLEDQRGTEINFELPEFLKDKENSVQGGRKYRKQRDGSEAMSSSLESLTASTSSKSNTQRPLSVHSLAPSPLPTPSPLPFTPQRSEFFATQSDLRSIASDTRSRSSVSSLGNSTVGIGTLNSTLNSTLSDSLDNTLKCSVTSFSICSMNSTLTNTTVNSQHGHLRAGGLVDASPPPLPPKPKNLPVKVSVWSNQLPALHAAFVRPADSSTDDLFKKPHEVKRSAAPTEITNDNAVFVHPSAARRDGKVCRGRRAVYLDQPSSSFV